MPRHNIDKTAPVEDPKKRTITFCKRKKELVMRAIELSNMCCVDVLLVVRNPESNRMTYFSSQKEFNLKAAIEAKKESLKPEYANLYERFTNSDYDLIQERDFRGVRYMRNKIYHDDSDLDSDETVSQDSKQNKR
jgi:ubiquitin C-terminal hydrolase